MNKFMNLLGAVNDTEGMSLARATELLRALKVDEIEKKQKEEAKKTNILIVIVGIILGIIIVTLIAYGVYNYYFAPDYLEDFEDDSLDDSDDEFEDDFFDAE